MSLWVDISQPLSPEFTLEAQLRAGAGTTVIYGRSGSGKTSLVRAIAGLARPARGVIRFGQETLFEAARNLHLPPQSRGFGYMFQEPRLFPHLTVAQNLDFGRRYARAPLGEDARAALIETLGIAPLLKRRPGALSGGERQRVALGRALIPAPRLLLLDEPLSALDGARKEEILPYLERLRAAGGPPMLYVTHDMNEIARLADHLVVLKEGRVAVQGPAQQVLSDPAHVPLIGVQEAGALLSARVIAQGADGLSRLALSCAELLLPRVAAAPGDMVRLRVRAQDIILAKQRPEGLSSRNILPCQITGLHMGQGPGVAVGLACGEDRLLARITDQARAEMGLAEGQPIWAIVKASSVAPAAIAVSAPQGALEKTPAPGGFSS